jgi:hypothetical protein
MKRLIIITLLLLAAAVVITVKYFKNLNLPGQRAGEVINTIPASATFIFEFNNDSSFYDIYSKSELFTAITGAQKMNELHTLRSALLRNNVLGSFFINQDIFISIHPQKQDSIDYLFTLPASTTFGETTLDQIKNIKLDGGTIKMAKIAGRNAYEIQLDSLSRNFYLAEKATHIWTGSFSKQLLEESLNYKPKDHFAFNLLSNQQSLTSLSNVYINNKQLAPLLEQLYKTDNITLWKGLALLPATTTLSLNYKSDALMFNGFTTLQSSGTSSYMSLFKSMKPVTTTLSSLFPITTAYSTSYAVNDVQQFIAALTKWHQKAGLDKGKAKLFARVKTETGVQFNKEFYALLDNEFSIVTTRFQENLAIIKIKNGALLKPALNNISTMINEDTGQLNYNQIPMFLLGDALTQFRRPYFIILDNYLILANTPRELSNYKENYLSNAFLSKDEEFTEFNNLLAQQCNISFFIHFKNASNVFKRTLKSSFAKSYQQEPGFKSYYAAAYQLSASENQFYNNLCIKLNSLDSVRVNK